MKVHLNVDKIVDLSYSLLDIQEIQWRELARYTGVQESHHGLGMMTFFFVKHLNPGVSSINTFFIEGSCWNVVRTERVMVLLDDHHFQNAMQVLKEEAYLYKNGRSLRLYHIMGQYGADILRAEGII